MVTELIKNPPAMQQTWIQSLVGKIPWRRGWLPTPVFWPGEFQGLHSSWGHKESDTWWLSKRSACNARDPGSVPESGRSPGEGDGYPLRYSCLENSMDRGAWWPTVHGVIKSRTRLRDSHFHFTHLCLHPGPTLGKLSDMGKALPAPKPVFSSAKLV